MLAAFSTLLKTSFSAYLTRSKYLQTLELVKSLYKLYMSVDVKFRFIASYMSVNVVLRRSLNLEMFLLKFSTILSKF